MSFNMSLRDADMVGVVLVLVSGGGLDGSWTGCVRWDGLCIISEGMEAALMVL